MRRPLANLLRRAGGACASVAGRLHRTEVDRQLDRWYRDDGEHTHRLRYDLTEQSLVIDVGGYQGQWSSDIYAMYQPTIHVFEPVKQFADDLKRRFQRTANIHVHQVGLSAANQPATIFLADNASSLFLDAGRGREAITLVNANEWLASQGIAAIDLLKIHTEGAEYDLIEHLIETGWIPRIRDLQVQFHDYAPNAHARLDRIRRTLGTTHDLTYQYSFLWENWRRR
jgi:FkbM family methyltransferase